MQAIPAVAAVAAAVVFLAWTAAAAKVFLAWTAAAVVLAAGAAVVLAAG